MKFLKRFLKPQLSVYLMSAFLTLNVTQASEKYIIAAFGDSLSAGYGLKARESFTGQLQDKFETIDLNKNVKILNAGNSGDTTSDGLARLDWSIGKDVDMVIIEFGANDGLRGLPVESAFQNLEQMIKRFKERKIAMLLTGMKAAPNMGEDYQVAFENMYFSLAKKYDIALYPFFLEGVAANPELNQADGIHPNNKGVAIIVENIFPYVLKVLEEDTIK